MATESAISKDKLVQDLKVVVADAEELLRATASQAGERVSAVREKVQDSLQRAKIKLAEAEDIVVDKGKQAARVTDDARWAQLSASPRAAPAARPANGKKPGKAVQSPPATVASPPTPDDPLLVQTLAAHIAAFPLDWPLPDEMRQRFLKLKRPN